MLPRMADPWGDSYYPPDYTTSWATVDLGTICGPPAFSEVQVFQFTSQTLPSAADSGSYPALPTLPSPANEAHWKPAQLLSLLFTEAHSPWGLTGQSSELEVRLSLTLPKPQSQRWDGVCLVPIATSRPLSALLQRPLILWQLHHVSCFSSLVAVILVTPNPTEDSLPHSLTSFPHRSMSPVWLTVGAVPGASQVAQW